MAALALLRTAVALDPLDLTAHRRLAAVLANSGDLQGAFDEHARYREFLRARGDLAALQKEVAYAAATLGELTRPRLLGESREPSVRLRESRSTRLRQRVRLLVLLVNGLLVLIVWAIVAPAPEAEEAALTTPTPTSTAALSTVPFALTAAPSPTPSVPSITQTPKPPTASMPVASPTVVLFAPSPSATVAPTATATTSSVLAVPSPAPTANTTPASSIGAHGLTERDAYSNAVGKPNTNAHSANVWPDRSDADPDPGGRHRRV
jgi:cytoskeletal protein RodZ